MLFFGVDLGKGLDHNSLSRLADEIPYSSSDLLYYTLLLPFTWTFYLKSNSLSPFSLFGKKFSKSNFNSAQIFLDNPKICRSGKIFPTSQKYSKYHFLPDLEKFPPFCRPFAYSCLRSLNGVH